MSSRQQAFLNRQRQRQSRQSPSAARRRQPYQQNTFSAASDNFINPQQQQDDQYYALVKEEQSTALFHVRNLIKTRNNFLRQVMAKHQFNKSVQSQLKQAQKRHNGVLLHILQTGTETVGGTMYTVLDKMTRAHDSHTEVVGSMSKHGGCSPLSIIEYVQTLHESHDGLVALVQELPVLAEKKLYNPAAQQATQQAAQQAPAAPPKDPAADVLDQHQQEAHADLSAAQTVHVLLMKEMAKKHELHHVVVNELHQAQVAHHATMKELLGTPVALSEVNAAMHQAHATHAALLKEILNKHELHPVARQEILGLHSSTGVVVGNIAERSEKVAAKIRVARALQSEIQREMKEEEEKKDGDGDALLLPDQTAADISGAAVVALQKEVEMVHKKMVGMKLEFEGEWVCCSLSAMLSYCKVHGSLIAV